MRVAFLNVNARATGGAEQSLALLVEHLPSDIVPVVICFEDGPFVARLRERGIDVHVLTISKQVRRTRRDGSWLAGAFGAPWDVARLARTLGALRVDVIHTNTMKGHVLGIAAGLVIRIPVVVHVRDMFEGNARIVMRALVRFSADHVSVSRAVARWYGLPEHAVVYNPLEIDFGRRIPSRADARTQLGLPQGVPIVGMVGRINRWKGHDRFLRIVDEVARSVPIHAVIVGEPRFRDSDFLHELRAQAAASGLADRVTFLGWQDDPRIAYAAITVHANCSTREPFGRSMLEAAACGSPSVAFDDGALGEMLEAGDIGAEVPRGDEAAFALATIDLVRAAPFSQPIIKNLERFSARVHADVMAARLRRAAGKRRLR